MSRYQPATKSGKIVPLLPSKPSETQLKRLVRREKY